MQALANYAMRGSVQAALVASSTLLLSIIFPPTVVVSSALVALTWLRMGWKAGLLVIAIAAMVAAAIASLSGLSPIAPVGMIISFWVPVVVMALVLRQTVSLDLSILAGAALAICAVLMVHLVVPDPAASWRELISVFMSNPDLKAQLIGSRDPAEFESLIDKVSGWMTGWYAAMLFLFAAFSLLLARAWQARLFNPGGLQKEFHGLRLGRSASGVGLAILLLASVLKFQVAVGLAIVVIAVFSFQGMAVVHALIARRGLAKGWLIGVYALLLLLLFESLLFVGLVGLADAWVNFREKFAGKA